MSIAVLQRLNMTVGRKIHALIGPGFVGLPGIAILDSGELASGLKRQKQIERQHLSQLAPGIVKTRFSEPVYSEFSPRT